MHSPHLASIWGSKWEFLQDAHIWKEGRNEGRGKEAAKAVEKEE